MFVYILKRILAAIPVMGFVALFVFLLLRLTPGDPAAIIAGDTATPEQLEAIRTSLGLNDPLAVQFFNWVSQLLQGDFGTSILSGKPVIELIADRMEPTISLALTTIILSVLIAVPLGVIAAWKQGTLIDRFVMLLSVLGFSVPVFVIGYLMISLFSMQLGWFPVQGFKPIGEGVGQFFHRIALPTFTLTLLYIALIARITRTSMLEILGDDYVRTARAKGLTTTQTLWRHGLRNALIPVLTIIGLQFSFLLAGGIIIEQVFYLPGLGRLVFQAISARDLIVVESVVMLLVFAVIVVNFAVDLAYAAVDPRLRART
jgi:peptide/nickel transport system permease protein